MADLRLTLERVLGWEGGFANDPDDTGGATMRGVTIGTYKTYCERVGKPEPTVEDLKNITYEEIYDLAYKLYWSKIDGDNIDNQSIAELCFDGVWGSGTGYIKIMQKVIGTKTDGIWGPKTTAAVNAYIPQEELFDKLWQRRKKYFEGCATAWKYLRGWMNRLNDFVFEPTPVTHCENREPVTEKEPEVQHAPDRETADLPAAEPVKETTAALGSPIDTGSQKNEVSKASSILQTIISAVVDIIKKLLKID